MSERDPDRTPDRDFMLNDGYPLLRAYERIGALPRFREMQAFAERFGRHNAAAMKYYSRRWVEDPLHHWSRRWEYLYVTECTAQVVRSREGRPVRVLDAGSGLTFFAHWLAHEFPRLRIECADRDPRAAASARRLEPPAQDTVSYTTQDLAALEHEAGSFDAVECVSVLEHSRNHDAIVAEFARVLRTDGALILTIDISPDGRWQIPPEHAAALIGTLDRHFESEADYATLVDAFDAARVLTTAHARERDPSLLPWKYPSLDNIRDHPLRPDRWLRPRFKYLSCFCMRWRARG